MWREILKFGQAAGGRGRRIEWASEKTANPATRAGFRNGPLLFMAHRAPVRVFYRAKLEMLGGNASRSAPRRFPPKASNPNQPRQFRMARRIRPGIAPGSGRWCDNRPDCCWAAGCCSRRKRSSLSESRCRSEQGDGGGSAEKRSFHAGMSFRWGWPFSSGQGNRIAPGS